MAKVDLIETVNNKEAVKVKRKIGSLDSGKGKEVKK
jgi:hypothetical protein